MPYVHRNNAGLITSISAEENEYCTEHIDDQSEELAATMLQIGSAQMNISYSDISMIRVIDDLVNILLEKSIISINDLPQAVQIKLLTRKSLRTQGSLGVSASELIKL